MINSNKFNVIIVGAGPAGIVCAMQLAQKGHSIALLEKETFPRDKICGDALSIDVINQLKLIDNDLVTRFKHFSKKTETNGVRIIAPNKKRLDIPFYYKGKNRVAYVSKRIDFDNFLFSELKQFKNIKIFEGVTLTNIQIKNDSVRVVLKETDKEINSLQAEMIIGADGAQSYVSKKLSNNKIDYDYYSAGLRVYHNNVSQFNTGNYIELHFLKEILPGYLWIFPLPNNQANVGIGMLSKDISKNKVNLKKTLKSVLENNKEFKDRFNNAETLETIKGMGLPLGNTKREISGNRYLLLGDAAGLIDPFSGEGIGNAIRSGRVAAIHAHSCSELEDYSAIQNKKYDTEIYRLMGKEFIISKNLQNLIRYPKLFNFIVSIANNSAIVKKYIVKTIENVDKKRMLTKISAYFSIFFKS